MWKALFPAVRVYVLNLEASLKAFHLCGEVNHNLRADSLKLRAELLTAMEEATAGKPNTLPVLDKLSKELKTNTRSIKTEIKASEG